MTPGLNSLSAFLHRNIAALLDLIYPPVCAVCQNIIEGQRDFHLICHQCLGNCEPVPTRFIRTDILNRLRPCYIDNMYIAICFDQTVQTVIHHIKYEKMNHLAYRFARWAEKFLTTELRALDAEYVVPVPLHPARRKERGYNQSLFIARGFFHSGPVSIREEILIRSRNTRSQTALNRDERKENVTDAFVVADAECVKGCHVILVDDVITTGATINECARILKKSGAAKVSALALATPVE
ncbi:MAG: ComF family protein [Calditrichia bacterium]